MPSFRITLTIGRLRPGVAPDALLPAAAAVAAEIAVLEASSVNVVSGEARLTVRFTADDDEIAEQVGGAVAEAAEALAEVGGERLTRRAGSRWLTVAVGHREQTLRQGYSAAQIREAEAPHLAAGEPLMARAAAGLAESIATMLAARRAPQPAPTAQQRVLVLAGPGNNGGDALFAAAALARAGHQVDIAQISERLHVEGLADATESGCRLLDIPPFDAAVAAAAEADAIVDGLFGTGSAGRDSAALSGTAADLVTSLLPLLDRPNAPHIIAVDIPSGIDADTGAVEGPVLPADVTVTFGGLKAGLLQGPAQALVGRVELIDIGLADELAKARPLLPR